MIPLLPPMRPVRRALGVLLVFLCMPVLRADPTVSSLLPRGAQRGTTVTLTLRGKALQHAEELLFHGSGLSVAALRAVNDKQTEVDLVIAEDCALGEHLLRLRTRQGLSALLTFWVGPFPEVAETEGNNTFDTAQEVPLDVTLTGVLKNEDQDLFRFQAERGDCISVEVEGIRLATTLFDPSLALLDQRGFEVAASDDSFLHLQDGLLSFLVPETGTWFLKVREASYQGNGNCHYRVHLGRYPRPLAVYPPGGKTGQELELTWLGEPTGPRTEIVTLPARGSSAFPLFAQVDGRLAPSPIPLRINGTPQVLEQEPNADPALGTGWEGELPVAFAGVIQETGDRDVFTFPAKKGQRLNLRIYARSLGSPLDSVISVLDETGKILVSNDDSRLPDSSVDFDPPADGTYHLRVQDHLGGGGPTFVYRAEVRAARPSLGLNMPRFGRDSQARQTVVVPRGNRTARVVHVNRNGFRDEVALTLRDLPEGVTVRTEPIPPEAADTVVLFEAPADAPLGARLMNVRGKAGALSGGYGQGFELVVGNPNRTPYYRVATSGLWGCVAEEAPFRVEVVPPTVPLSRFGNLDLVVKVVRAEGFEGAVTLRMLWKPPGVGAATTMAVAKDQDTVTYPLSADSRAVTRTWNLAILGEATVERQTTIVSSDLIPLTVVPPYLTGSLQMAVVERGAEGAMVCKLEGQIAFEGTARLSLVNLPHEVTSVTQEITAETKEVIFPVSTTEKSPKGRHKKVFCRLEVPREAGPVVHGLAYGGVLRIDPPPPPKKGQKPKPKAEKSKPVTKPLSRLEQLRADARKQQEQQKKDGGDQ